MADTLTITDNRTGKQYEVPIKEGAIRATDLKQIKAGGEDTGLMTYDPAFLNTAACRSAITYIDGDKGILWYRGYPIEQLAEHCNYLEVAYLIIFGELPTETQLQNWDDAITQHTLLHENVKKLMEGFQYDAHPMGIFISTVGALSTLYRDAKLVFDQEARNRQCLRLIAKVASIAGYAYRHSIGRNYVYPDNDLSFTGNFLNMLFKMTELKYKPNPVLERALDVLFILHADHEQNCSTTAMRVVGSSHVDPYSSIAGAAAALWGPLHGGANEAVLRMLEEIGTIKNVPAFISRVKAGDGRLMGFGHRVYKSYDPSAKIIKRIADEVFEVTGRNPLLDIALELERIALQDEYFVTRKLYPNVDFYSGLIYQAMGFPKDFFPVLFAIPRTAGWFAQWEEMLRDPEQKIARPRQIYVGSKQREFVPRDKTVTGSGFRFQVLGSGARSGSGVCSCCLRSSRLLSPCPWPAPEAQSSSSPQPSSTARGPTSTCARSSASGRGRRGLRPSSGRANTSSPSSNARDPGRAAGVRRRRRPSATFRWSTSSRRSPARARIGSPSRATTTPSCFVNFDSWARTTADRAPRS